MKIEYNWDSTYAQDQMGVWLNPVNQDLQVTLGTYIGVAATLTVLDPANNCQYKLEYREILGIQANGEWSKVQTVMGKTYLLHERLKSLARLEDLQFFRINNAWILNFE